MTAVYSTLFAAVQSTLESVSAIKAIYPYPVMNIEMYPAVIFFPDSFDNSFESTAQNQKTHRFKMYVVVGAAQKDKFDIFNTILPKAVDAVVSAFDAAWDAGTVQGSRVRMLINSGHWAMVVGDAGLEAVAELTVEFRLLTSL
jgi:predicted phage tail protein